MPFALFPLILAAFAIGTTEFVIMGLLPDVALNFAVTIPQAGLLVSSYAMGVVIGGPLLALVTSNMPERRALTGLFALFILGNILCALSPNYGMLMAARIVTAFAHGTFLGVAAVVAMDLAPPGRRTEAVGYLLSGITSANVVGVPIGIALGQAYGWRCTFAAVAILATCAVVWLLITLPPSLPKPKSHIWSDLKSLKTPPFCLALALTAACSTSLLCLFTYITPFLLDVTHVTHAAVTQTLLVYGVGLTVGTAVGGRVAKRGLLGPIAWGLSLSMVVLACMPYLGQSRLPCTLGLFVWGTLSFGLCPILQTLVITHAPKAPNLASTLTHSAFNLGNALGAYAGSVALTQGQPIRFLPWTCVGLSMVALALLGVQSRLRPVHQVSDSDELQQTAWAGH